MQAEDAHPTGDDVPHMPRTIPNAAAPTMSEPTLSTIHALVAQAAKDAADTRQDIAAILDKVKEVSVQVGPLLEGLMKNPMLKMLLK